MLFLINKESIKIYFANSEGCFKKGKVNNLLNSKTIENQNKYIFNDKITFQN